MKEKTEYTKLTPLRLRLSYEHICEEYRIRLCKQFGISCSDTYWISGRVGCELDIQSYYVVDMEEIIYIVESFMTFEEFEEWYDQWINIDDENRINLMSWKIGSRPKLFNNKP